MNIEYATAIPLDDILSKMGRSPAQEKTDYPIYPAPFSNTLDHTIAVDIGHNQWRDRVTGGHGGPIELVQAYLQHQDQRCSIVDALHWLKFNIGYPPLSAGLDLPDDAAQIGQFAYSHHTKLIDGSLYFFLHERGIPFAMARKFFRQVGVSNTTDGHEFQAAGIATEEKKSFAIYNPHIEAIAGRPAITFLRGSIGKPSGVHIFKDVFDYLSVLLVTHHDQLKEDVMILNSYYCLDDAAKDIRGYGYHTLYTWMPSDAAGDKVTNAFAALCRSEEHLKHQPMNNAYAGYRSMNDKLIADLAAANATTGV